MRGCANAEKNKIKVFYIKFFIMKMKIKNMLLVVSIKINLKEQKLKLLNYFYKKK